MRVTMLMIWEQIKVTNFIQMIKKYHKCGNTTKADELMMEAERLITTDQSGTMPNSEVELMDPMDGTGPSSVNSEVMMMNNTMVMMATNNSEHGAMIAKKQFRAQHNNGGGHCRKYGASLSKI